MNQLWTTFYERYRRGTPESEADLFAEVARTVNGQPITRAVFELDLQRIIDALDPQPDDLVCEFCCGNGLATYEIARCVRHVVAMDFTEHLIDAARRMRARENIEYHLANALDPIAPLLAPDDRPTKYLMSFALQHFAPPELDVILGNVLAVSPPGSFRMFVTHVPDVERKWNFYDTPERRAHHLQNMARGDVIHDGIGRWWSRDELSALASKHGLEARIEPQPETHSNYRMDVLFT